MNNLAFHKVRSWEANDTDFQSPVFFWLTAFLSISLALGLVGCGSEEKDLHKRSASFQHDLLQSLQKGDLARCGVTLAAERVQVNGREHEIQHVKVVTPNQGLRSAAERAVENAARRNQFSFQRLESPRDGGGFVLYEISENRTRISSVLLSLPSKAFNRTAPQPPMDERLPLKLNLPKTFVGDYKVAIIIDDLGNDLAIAEALCEFRQKITLSIMPDLKFTRETAELAKAKGKEVMIHLPMEPESREGLAAGPRTILVSMTPHEVESLFNEALRTVPFAVGMNNHMGSKATANRALMMEIMTLAKLHGLYFVDSRTTPATQAFAVARELGVPTHFRSVFLDDKAELEYSKAQFDVLLKRMLEHGSAIAIGHPYASTLETLRIRLPEIERRGVKVVFASKLVS